MKNLPGSRKAAVRIAEYLLWSVALTVLTWSAWVRLDAALHGSWTEWALKGDPTPSWWIPFLSTFTENDPQTMRKTRTFPMTQLQVERLGVKAPVEPGVQEDVLRRGVGHIPGTSWPGESGNIGLAAHRDTFFRPLKDIRKNDRIVLRTPQREIEYRVEWTSVVNPDDTHVLEPSGHNALTLVTCYPFYYIGKAPQRFVVRAREVSNAGTEKRKS
ncbi:MAG: class D sortase [Acidobacteria bacterium]|nr:class D sortase [Acidobacteriota bacterium]